MAPRSRAGRQHVGAAAVALPPVRGGPRGRAARPGRRLSTRSLLAVFALLVVFAGLYVYARESSLFAIHHVEVSGAPPGLAAQVRQAVAPLLGTSLVRLDGVAVERRVESLPGVVSAAYDRAFPHTLRISVVPERPVAVLRLGGEAWVVSARARLIRRTPVRAAPPLPRIWAPAATRVEEGAYLADEVGGVAARALTLAGRFSARVRSVSYLGGSLVFHLRSGVALRLGEATDIRLKLAVARRALAALPPGSTYLDVSLPSRLVAGTNPQVSG